MFVVEALYMIIIVDMHIVLLLSYAVVDSVQTPRKSAAGVKTG